MLYIISREDDKIGNRSAGWSSRSLYARGRSLD